LHLIPFFCIRSQCTNALLPAHLQTKIKAFTVCKPQPTMVGAISLTHTEISYSDWENI